MTDNASPFFKLSLTCGLGFVIWLTLLLLSSGPACAEWVQLGSDREGGMTIYVAPHTIRRNGDVVKLWGLTDFKTIQTESSPPYLSVKSQREIDCAEERIRLVAVTAFSGNMGSGKMLYSYTDSKDQGIPVESGSVAHSLWKFACGKE
jgi:surface-adhesin protein E